MEYQTSQFDYLYLLNIPVPIVLTSGELITLKTPNIYDYHLYDGYRKIEDLFLIPLEDLEKNAYNYGFVAEGYLELILGAKSQDMENSMFELLEEISGLKIDKRSITCNGVPLIEEDVLQLRYAYLLSTGKVDINGELIGEAPEAEPEDEMTRKLREHEERIKAIRGENSSVNGQISFKDMLMLIMYELNKSSKELQELNFFGLYELYSLALKAAYDKIEKTAAGNGLLPKDKAYQNILSD